MMSHCSTNSTNFYTMNNITGKQNFSPMVQEVNLPNLRKRRKSVSFNDKVNITNVESWKRFNTDMSEQSEFNILKRKFQEDRLKQKEKIVCSCSIF